VFRGTYIKLVVPLPRGMTVGDESPICDGWCVAVAATWDAATCVTPSGTCTASRRYLDAPDQVTDATWLTQGNNYSPTISHIAIVAG